MPAAPLPALTDPLRRLLVKRVQAVFNDRARGESPVVRSDHALYPRDSVIWRVHGDVTTMMIGGVTALLLQMLHPAALAGVWDHSTFRDDMLGRLRRTARFIAVTTFGERSEAEAAILRVRQVHEHVRGVLADGTPYAAGDPELLAWVHVCEAIGFLDAWLAFGDPAMPLADQDTYFAQAGEVASALGADPIPRTRAEAEALIARFKPTLVANARSREVARMVLNQPAPSLAAMPVQRLLMQAAVEILPPWAREMHRLALPPLSGPVVRGGATAVAGTLRWAFAQTKGR
ncbi:MAG: oxygenase MpaB family protein [Novosphingobium sp.]